MLEVRMNPSMKTQGFSASSQVDDGKLMTKLSGNADVAVRTALADFLNQVHEAAKSQSVSQVVVDLRDLEFMNSACLKTMVTWIFVARELPTQSRYQILLVSDPAVLWQRRSVQALSCVATELVKLQS
jgi:anti-anti-sigma factor